MKAVVFVWSYLVFMPLLTPFAMLPILWLIRKLFISASEYVNAAFLMFLFMAMIGYATYFNFTQGINVYAKFLAQRGVETEATVVGVESRQTLFVNGKVDEVEILFRNEASRTFKLKYLANENRLFPPIENLVLPKTGEKVQIRYFPTVESAFIVLTDSGKSEYGGKIVCQSLEAALKKAETQYKFADSPTPDLKKSYAAAIQAVVDSNCLDLSERTKYKDVLSTIH